MTSFLADLARLRRDAPQGDALAPDDALQASLASALRERGIDSHQLAELEGEFFAGSPGAYKHILKYLESMPPAARVAAHVRCAEALLMWRRLSQSVS